MRRAMIAAIAGAGVLLAVAGSATPAPGQPAAGPVVPSLVSPGLVPGDLVGRNVTQMRPLPRVLFGVTVDDVGRLRELVTSARHLPEMPTTRVYFDVSEPPRYYATAVRRLHPVSYLMGELLDSSDEMHISVAAYRHRVKSYLAAFRNEVDLWEIGNETNGNWTGRYGRVEKKLTAAYRDVIRARRRTALTLYYNAGCGDGRAELSPLGFSRRYVPRTVRNGLTHVFLSYYERNCHGIRPSARSFRNYFRKLHVLYPHALLGFGEIGLRSPAGPHAIAAARSLISYYYGLRIRLPYYVGGYFWWYYAEDCLPYSAKPLWSSLRAGFWAEAASLRPGR
jgi:hypothetical protein